MNLAPQRSLDRAEEFVRHSRTLVRCEPRPLVIPVIEGFRRFTQLPRDEKLRWQIQMPWQPGDDPDDGYLNRKEGANRPQGGVYDAKELFHWRPYLENELRSRGVDVEAWHEWFESCEHLYRLCRTTIIEFASQLDVVLPGYGFRERVLSEEAERNHVLRFILYDPVKVPGQELGKAHPDRDSITIHLDENQPGLVTHDHDGERRLYVPNPGEVMLFAGKKLAEQTHQEIRALIHSIVSPPELGIPSEQRWSVIFFSHAFAPSA